MEGPPARPTVNLLSSAIPGRAFATQLGKRPYRKMGRLALVALVLHGPLLLLRGASGCNTTGSGNLTGTAVGAKRYFLARGMQSCSSACAERQQTCDLEGVAVAAHDLATCRRAIGDIGRNIASYGTYYGVQGGCTFGNWGDKSGNWAQIMSRDECSRDYLVLDWEGGVHVTGHAMFGTDGNSSAHFADREIAVTHPADACSELNTTGDRDLRGKVALIQRGTCKFKTKVVNAEKAGAIAVIIYNNQGTYQIVIMAAPRGDTTSVSIPALFISKQNGEALKASIEKSRTTATLR